ncbi:hypothetical protein [Niastella sp. OAS944]|nr:hypothetical protein [Chitinophagaceae bacterium OAS944]
MIKYVKPCFLFLLQVLIDVETFTQSAMLNGVFAGFFYEKKKVKQ